MLQKAKSIWPRAKRKEKHRSCGKIGLSEAKAIILAIIGVEQGVFPRANIIY
jgi:hypothetical protein